jgi:hypothetical protein
MLVVVPVSTLYLILARAETRRLKNGAQLISLGNGCPISWIMDSPTVWFDTEYLASLCPVVRVLLAPGMEQINQSDSIQAPFCLQCHNCYEIGVYGPKKFVSHCLQCLPQLLGYAAADRFAQSILTLFHIVTASEAQGALQPVCTLHMDPQAFCMLGI